MKFFNIEFISIDICNIMSEVYDKYNLPTVERALLHVRTPFNVFSNSSSDAKEAINRNNTLIRLNVFLLNSR